MGRIARPKSKHLPAKLKQIRLLLGKSQNEMVKELGLHDEIYRSTISGYETGGKEIPLPYLLKYARLMGISTDVLIDDLLDLPEEITIKRME